MINIFICDDESINLEIYSEILRVLCKKHAIESQIKCFSDGTLLIDEITKKTESLGIIFLDIRMPKIDGITVAKRILKLNLNVKIIFLTAAENYILQALDVGAFNYLIKNHSDDERFEKVFIKALDSFRKDKEKYIVFWNAKEYRSVPINDIMYFEVFKRIVTVNYANGHFEFFSSLAEVEDRFRDNNFVRIHRSYIVSLLNIESVFYSKLKLRDGTILPIGRTYVEKVKAAFKQFYER